MYHNTITYLLLIFFSFALSLHLLSFSSTQQKKKTTKKQSFHRPHIMSVLGLTLVIYFCLFLILEILEYHYGVRVWDQTERTVRSYEWFEQYINNEETGGYDKDKRFDYSESLFFGKDDLPIEQATQQKYDYIFTSLGLQPGMRLLDCGCGIGTWIDYCRQHGVDTVGLTLSQPQVDVGRQKGLDLRCQDYRLENPEFYESFDCITVLGSSEHVCSSHHMKTTQDRCRETQTDLYSVLQKYLRPHGRILITALVNNLDSQYTIYDYIQSYILERHYGGYYISIDNLRQALERNGLTILSCQDMTRDYHWTSVVAPEHFGHWYISWSKNPLKKIGFICQGLCTDPFLLHHWLYYSCDTWMWQFGGYQKTPLTDSQIREAPAQLKYILVEKC